MKNTALLFVLLLFVIIGCKSTSDSVARPQNLPDSDSVDAEYQKLYYDYRTLVTETINSNNETTLSQITDEYISKTEKNIFLITVSQLDPSGKWRVLLHKTDPNMPSKLPNVHYAYSGKVHVYKGKGYVLCESNKTRNRTYTDNIYIKMAIKR